MKNPMPMFAGQACQPRVSRAKSNNTLRRLPVWFLVQ
jgi:hypothetical protein